MTTQSPDFGVTIARAQPVTEAHGLLVAHAMSRLSPTGKLFLVNGSSFAAPRWDYVPFREFERIEMWMRNLTDSQKARVEFINQKDYGNMATWATKLREKVMARIGDEKARVALIGCAKDAPTGYYLSQFPDWESISVPVMLGGLSATPIRDRYIRDENWHQFEEYARPYLPAGTMSFLQDFRRTNEFAKLLAEKTFMVDYNKQFYDAEEVALAKAEGRRPRWGAPYPVTHYTADSVVIQGTKLLMVQRKGYPCKDLWALPGGHCGDDIAVDAAIRELREETKIAVPEDVLRGSIVGSKVYDDPNRSTRRRTVTTAQFIHLTPRIKPGMDAKTALAHPKVRAADDAKKARWVEADWVENNRELIMEDHWKILQDALSSIQK